MDREGVDLARVRESPGEPAEWVDRRVLDPHGETVGIVVDVYVDLTTGRPAWLAISGGYFGTRISVAPVCGASARGPDIVVAHSRAVIDAAPAVASVVSLPSSHERSLIDHYGATTQARTATGRQQP